MVVRANSVAQASALTPAACWRTVGTAAQAGSEHVGGSCRAVAHAGRLGSTTLCGSRRPPKVAPFTVRPCQA
eukprot:15430810-Alexandrium_andersonii.AAC.1